MQIDLLLLEVIQHCLDTFCEYVLQDHHLHTVQLRTKLLAELLTAEVCRSVSTTAMAAAEVTLYGAQAQSS